MGQDNVDMDPFLLPLSNGKRLFSLEDEGNNETFNFDESAWFQNGNFLGDSNSPFPWGDNVENTDYEDMNLGSLFHNESESTLDASILKPKRKRMRSRIKKKKANVCSVAPGTLDTRDFPCQGMFSVQFK